MKIELWHLKRMARIPIFAHIEPEELLAMVKDKKFHIVAATPGKILAQRGSACISLMALIDGQLSASMIDHQGKMVTVETLLAPRLVAPAFLFGSSPQYPVDVLVAKPSIVLTIPRDDLIAWFSQDQKLLTSFLDQISNRAQFLSHRLWFLSSKSIAEKIANYFKSLSIKQNNLIISLPMSITELSNFFAISRPALSRSLKELSDQAIIKRNGRLVTLLKPDFFGLYAK